MNEIISKYVGEKYSHNDKRGLDCLGLVVSFLHDNGIETPRDDGLYIKKDWYNENPNRLLDGLERHCIKVDISELQALDILAFEFDGVVRHLGVMVSRSRFLHARKGRLAAITRLRHYKKYLHSIWRAR